ncbi:MAG: hypothetical protein WA639_22665 [Candidatus Acidiferrum sp.]
MRSAILAVFLIATLPALALAQGTSGLASDQLPANFTLGTHPHTLQAGMPAAGGGGVIGRRSSGSLLGIDSVANWSSYFYYPGVDGNGFPQFTWEYTMVGNSPFSNGQNAQWGGQTTRVGAPVVAVNLDLRNADGSPRYVGGQRLYYDATQFVQPVLNSPVFSNTFYSSSNTPTQFTDAVMRAEFFQRADDGWHTLLRPRIAKPRTMVLIRGTYYFALNSDGSCCAYVLIDYNTFVNALFPATPTDTTTPIGAAENAGDITTKDISSFLFPNAYLYFNGNPNDCCVLGFHSYDLEPGGPNNGFQERRYIMNYSSWITPGLFGTAFADITALSHEMSETFNDPFGGNATPWWLAPNGNCQNNLETGDVIEGLPNAVYPVSLNGSTWSPQNEALLPWFAGQTPSSAIHHAYSYPDATVLTATAVSQNAGCTPPLP